MNFIKKTFKKLKKSTSNQQGSVLSVSLIVIAILSLSVTTLTGNTVNLSSATTVIEEKLEDTTFAKKLINYAMIDLKDYLYSSSSDDPLNDYFTNELAESFISNDTSNTYGWWDGNPETEGKIIKIEIDKEKSESDTVTVLALKFTYFFTRDENGPLEDGPSIFRYTYYQPVVGEGFDGGVGNIAIAMIVDDAAVNADQTFYGYDPNEPISADQLIIYNGMVFDPKRDLDAGVIPGVTGPSNVDWSSSWNAYFKILGAADDIVDADSDAGFDPTKAYEIDFYFSLVSGGDLYLNGGIYNIPSLHAQNIYAGFTPFYGNSNSYDVYIPTETFDGELYPNLNHFTRDDGYFGTKIFLNGDYRYCLESNKTICVTLNDDQTSVKFDQNGEDLPNTPSAYFPVPDTNPESPFTTYGNIQEYSLTNFFDAYKFNDELLNFTNEISSTGFQAISDIINLTDLENPTEEEQDAYDAYLDSNPDYTKLIGEWLDEQSYYQLYLINYPDYTKTEKEWIDDLISGLTSEDYTGSIVDDIPVYDKNKIDHYTFGCPSDKVFCDISENAIYADEFWNLTTVNFNAIYDGRENGPLTITDSYYSSEDYTLVVLGDLHIDMSGTNKEIMGNILVTGNTYFEGDSVRYQGTLITLGQTIIDFNDGNGFYAVDGTAKNFTLLSRDNILIQSHYGGNVDNNIQFYGFIYSEESVYVDAVNSAINLKGSIYARAKGETDYPLTIEGSEGQEVSGIFINSIFGHYDGTVNAASNLDDLDLKTRFIITNINEDYIQVQFKNLPLFEVYVSASATFIDDSFEEE